MNNFKKIAFILVVVVVFLQFFIIADDKKEESSVPTIAVSTFSLYDITKHIAGDSVEIVNILPFGVDPHSFEPTPKLMAQIETSSLVLFSGAGLEPWIHGFEFKTRAINISKHVKLRELHSDEFEFHKHHDHQCAHNKLDPHYWLDFENMKKMTILIKDELIKLSPENRDIYSQNAEKYTYMLTKLDQNYKKHLSSCRVDTVILNHNSISYLAQNYNFHVESLSGLSPEAQPTASDIKRILNDIHKEGISTIFFENFVNDRVIKSIAKDADVKIDVIQPLGNITAEEARREITYEDVMYLNLKKLSEALVCK